MTRGWEWVDSWVLMGLGADARPLEEVIAHMDALNHAIPMREELEIGLRWLAGAGVAIIDDGAYRLTSEGDELVRRAAGPTRSWHATWDRVEAALKELPRPREPPEWQLSAEEYNRAVQAYLARWK